MGIILCKQVVHKVGGGLIISLISIFPVSDSSRTVFDSFLGKYRPVLYSLPVSHHSSGTGVTACSRLDVMHTPASTGPCRGQSNSL